MSSAAKIAIMARAYVQPFAGYHLWGIALRENPKQRWDNAIVHYGRCDTLDQAWGFIFELTGSLSPDSVREDSLMFKWPACRDAIRAHGEARRFEGSIAWSLVSDDRRAELAAFGAVFRDLVRFAEKERQAAEAARERAYYQQYTSVRLNTLPGHHLKVLGLPTNTVDMSIIKTAYRKLAGLHHPDRGGDAGRFVAVRQAYEALAKLAC